MGEDGQVCMMCGGPADCSAMCPNGETRPCCGKCIYTPKPKVICLCGSTRFYEEFAKANLELTLQGYIVLSVGAYVHDDSLNLSEQQKRDLDRLHKYKIALADEVLVLNKDGYIGQSTRSEIEYAELSGKPVRYMWTPNQQD